MSYVLRTILDPRHRKELFARLERLDASQPPRWGRLTAPAMVVHLCDQMRMPFNEHPSGRIPGVPPNPIMRLLALHVLPWPRGVIQGPPEAFRSAPGEWSEDLATLEDLVVQFVNTPADRALAEHPNWGRLSRRQWGVFCYRHFDHHLTQFGV